MTAHPHLVELRRKHTALSAEVEAAQRAPGSDTLTIADLKKRKLMLKEEIARMS